MIDEILKNELARECTLVEATSKVVEYKGHTYELKHYGSEIMETITASREDAVDRAKRRFYKALLHLLNFAIIRAVKCGITEKITLNKDEIININKNNKMICNSKTVEWLDKFNIKYPKENLIIAEEIYGNKVYIVNLKDILFFYTKDVKPRVLNKGHLQVELMCIYARAYLDRNKDVKITEIEIKE